MFWAEKGQIWPCCWTQSKLIEGRLLTTAQARSQMSKKDLGMFTLEQDVLASRDGAQKIMEERSRPGFVSHGYWHLVWLICCYEASPCNVRHLSVSLVSTSKLPIACCTHLCPSYTVSEKTVNVTGIWEPSFLYKRKYYGQIYRSKINFVYLRNLKMGEV